MKWIKASDRKPQSSATDSRTYFCRHVKTGQRKVLWYGKGGQSLLAKEPTQWEWLDEDAVTDYNTGFFDGVAKSQIHVSQSFRNIQALKP